MIYELLSGRSSRLYFLCVSSGNGVAQPLVMPAEGKTLLQVVYSSLLQRRSGAAAHRLITSAYLWAFPVLAKRHNLCQSMLTLCILVEMCMLCVLISLALAAATAAAVTYCCSYGLDLFLLSIDEGIRGYRDDSLETVKRNEETYKIPLRVLSYEELYGWSMDQIVAQIGTKNNCTFCGVFR